MTLDLHEWNEDLSSEESEEYETLIRVLKIKEGFGLFFVQCNHLQAEKLVANIPHFLPQKKIEILCLNKPIHNLYDWVFHTYQIKKFDILLIKGLEHSIHEYEQSNFNEITETKFNLLESVPPILNHLNQQRERFRDNIPSIFVFLVPPFVIDYLIYRAPDFFDWRSSLFKLSNSVNPI
ncbi:MAG TPA: hypothetical protein VK184_20190 [Nostocaceae cyanobacterium]|nr:hypothetical protein [Nostocaceae cyanobacterium]